jgi:hypothetical protein
MISVAPEGGLLTFLIPYSVGTISPPAPPGEALRTLSRWQSEVEEIVERLGGRHPAGGPFGGRRRGDGP